MDSQQEASHEKTAAVSPAKPHERTLSAGIAPTGAPEPQRAEPEPQRAELDVRYRVLCLGYNQLLIAANHISTPPMPPKNE